MALAWHDLILVNIAPSTGSKWMLLFLNIHKSIINNLFFWLNHLSSSKSVELRSSRWVYWILNKFFTNYKTFLFQIYSWMLVGLPAGTSQHSMNLMVPINCPCCSVQRGRVLLQKCQVDPPIGKVSFPLCHTRGCERHACPFEAEKPGVQILVPALTCCVILGELLKHTEPQFSSSGK